MHREQARENNQTKPDENKYDTTTTIEQNHTRTVSICFGGSVVIHMTARREQQYKMSQYHVLCCLFLKSFHGLGGVPIACHVTCSLTMT